MQPDICDDVGIATRALSGNKKPSDPGKSENEGIQDESHSAHAEQAGLILLFDGEAPRSRERAW